MSVDVNPVRRWAAAIAAVFLFASFGTVVRAQGNRQPLAVPPQTLKVPVLKLDQLRDEVNALNAFIGGYPPRWVNDAERAEVYRRWGDALQNARAYVVQAPKDVRIHFLLAELFRQGHNMDVAGTADSAEDAINHCLDLNADYVPCLFSSSYFYMSLDAKFANRAKRSLLRLKRIFGAKPNLEVERALVQVYANQGKRADALKQVDYYLKLDPGSAWAKNMKKSLRTATPQPGSTSKP